jgi:hypothetical protein
MKYGKNNPLTPRYRNPNPKRKKKGENTSDQDGSGNGGQYAEKGRAGHRRVVAAYGLTKKLGCGPVGEIGGGGVARV